MKRLVLSAIVAAATLAITVPAHAASSTGNFAVDINLTPVCTVTMVGGNITFNYTSFQAGAATGTLSTTFDVQCTKSMAYTLAITGGSGTLITDSITELQYTLTLSGTGMTSTGATASYSVNGSMAGGQGGSCGTIGGGNCDNNGAANKAKTVTLTY